MDSLAIAFFDAAADYRATLDQIGGDLPIDATEAAAASAASIAERDAVGAVAAAPIATAEDAAAAASVLAHLLTAEAWPDEARALARALSAAVERLSTNW